MKPNNPFLITGYSSPLYFCDREEETKKMVDALDNGRNLTLIAPRRMGKTGLIKNVFYNLKEKHPEVITFYMDIYSTQNRGDFIKLLASTVLGKLDSAPQKAISRIGKYLKSIRPIFTLDEFTGVPKVTIEMAPGNEENTLSEIFEYLKSSEKKCVLAIDEFQQIGDYPEKGMEALLRSHIQFLPNVVFIFSGSKQHIMQEMFLSAKRPFYLSTQIITIDSIDSVAYYNFAASFFLDKDQQLKEEDFFYIYNEFDGHTWYIQAILNRLYSYSKSPSKDLINNVIEQLVSEYAYSYETLMTAYSQSNVSLIKAIANEGIVKEIHAGDFIVKYRLKATSTVNTALKNLISKELVYKSPNGYIVYDRFMSIWLKQQSY